MSASIKEYRGWRGRIIAATPLICLIAYLAIGFIWGIWHPTWAIFFLIIIVPMMLSENVLYSIYPIVCLAAFLVLGFTGGWWHPAWLIFLTIPVYYTLFSPLLNRKKKKKSKKEKIVEIIEGLKDEE